MKVYAFEWCDCVYESAYGVQSLHATKAGAERAMEARLEKQAADVREMHAAGYPDYEERYTAHRVREIEVLP